MTISYVLQPVPIWLFNDLTGRPAAGGKLFVKSSLNPNVKKTVYSDPELLTPYTNPVIFNANGMAPGPFYWKIDSDNPQDLYYLIFTDNTGATTQDEGNVIWSINKYPVSGSGGGGGGGTAILPENIFVNSSFIYNIGATSSSPIANNTFLCPGAHSDLTFPDINYIASGTSDAVDNISFVSFNDDPGTGINPISPDFLTDYYLRYQCTNSPTGEVYKGIQIPISKNVNNLSNQTLTLTFYARKVAGSGNQLNFVVRQYFGTGGSPSPEVLYNVSSPRNLTGSFVLYSVTFTIPSTLTKNLGNSNDDATYLQIRFPTGSTTTIDIFKPMLYVGSSFPTTIYESIDEIETELQLPRTGDVKISANSFSNFSTSSLQNGWIPLNDGTIGNDSSGATTRAKYDTWLLYKLLWDNTSAANCPIFDSSGNPVAKGGSALSDWNSNNRLQLPSSVGRVLADRGTGANALGNAFGNNTATLSTSNLPPHNHALTIPMGSGTGAASNASRGTTSGSGNLSLSTGNGPGTSTPFSIEQKTVYYNMIIKL